MGGADEEMRDNDDDNNDDDDDGVRDPAMSRGGRGGFDGGGEYGGLGSPAGGGFAFDGGSGPAPVHKSLLVTYVVPADATAGLVLADFCALQGLDASQHVLATARTYLKSDLRLCSAAVHVLRPSAPLSLVVPCLSAQNNGVNGVPTWGRPGPDMERAIAASQAAAAAGGIHDVGLSAAEATPILDVFPRSQCRWLHVPGGVAY